MKRLFCLLAFFMAVECYSVAKMPKGFQASPTSDGNLQFQPILLSQNSRFALGFKKMGENSFLLCVVCVPDLSLGFGNLTEIVWTANRNNAVTTASEFVQNADGSLALTNENNQATPAWEVHVANDVHVEAELALLDTGNLQLADVDGALWQSFDHPTDTLLQGQNFTATMNLTEGEYSLQMDAAGMSLRWKSDQVYWRRLAMQEKALIIPGNGPIYARLESDGYIAMYQTESQLVDVLPLDTYHQNVTVRRLKIESDGNLRSYYWSPRSSQWEIDLVAVESNCQLPSFCGPSALCTVDSRCTCLRSPTISKNQGCLTDDDFCARPEDGVARIPGADLPFSRYSNFTAVDSESECRDLCAGNCGCAAVVYSNNSKRCYVARSPLQTLAQVATIDRVAFVKYVNETIFASNDNGGALRVFGWVAVAVAASGVVAAAASAFILWRRRLSYKGKGDDSDISIQMGEKFMGGLAYEDLTKQSSML